MSEGTPDVVPDNLEEAQEQIRQLQAQQAAMQAERDYLWQRTEQAEAEKRQLQDAKSHAEAEVERLRGIIAQLRRRQYGPRSERLDPEQYRLKLDALHEQLRQAEAAAAAEAGDDENDGADAPAGRPGKGKTGKKKPARNQGALPEDLPTVEDVVEPETESCSCCGGALHRIGEDVTEQLEWVPGYLQKRRTRRPKYGCRSCESAPVQAEAPASPVPGGLPTCSTVAHLLTAKYLDSLPLYRQSEMLARQGVDLDRSTLVRWVGGGGRHLALLYDALFADVMASAKIFGDETPMPTLEPGRGKTKKAYFWTYARDDRPWGGPDPPAVVYCYADGRGQDHPARHLKDFRGILQVDGYGAYGAVAKKRRAPGSSSWRSAGRTSGARSTTSTPAATRRSRKRPCAGSAISMRSRTRSGGAIPRPGRPCARRKASRCSTTSTPGWRRAWPSCRPRTTWRRRSSGSARAGRA